MSMKFTDVDVAKQLAETLGLLHLLHSTALTEEEAETLKAAAQIAADRLKHELATDEGAAA